MYTGVIPIYVTAYVNHVAVLYGSTNNFLFYMHLLTSSGRAAGTDMVLANADDAALGGKS